jgi:hypothetical protein
MHVININSSIDISFSQKLFVKEILNYTDDYFYPFHYKRINLNLLEKIPIFLINDKSMKKYDDLFNKRMKQYNEEVRIRENFHPESNVKPPTELFGFYKRENNEIFEDTPIIVICLERIEEFARNNDEFIFLFTKVLIHELSHAIMDWHKENQLYGNYNTFFYWMEESLANQLTLDIIESSMSNIKYHSNKFHDQFINKFVDFVENFIKHQPPAYALGYELYKKRVYNNDWRWRREKENLGGRKKMKSKKKWLQYVQQNYKSIDRDVIEKLYDELFS